MTETNLASWLHQHIAEKGPLRVSDYMRACLLHETYGYYKQATVFGRDGDFITAPEISQLFGEMLAAFHGHLHQLFGAPENAILFEAGPGRGTLARDMHHSYQAIAPALASAPCYHLEASKPLQQAQTDALAPKIPHFLTSISELPKAPLFGVANEFFDALGVDHAIYVKDTWHHRLIDSHKTGFCFTVGAPISQADGFTLPDSPEQGDIIETSPSGEAIMAELAHHIAYYGGGVLIIDYGKSDNKGDTLQAVKDHKPADILCYQGEADITHWVDFSRLSAIATANQARLIGPVTQGRFLKEIGIEARAEALRQPDKPDADRALIAAIDRLVSPAQMGHAFKVALLVPAGDGVPPGFTDMATKTETYQ